MRESTLENVGECWPPPERVVLVTSVDRDGKPNIISVGWKMRANSSPPVFAVAINVRCHSHSNIAETGEFVFAVPGADLAKAVMYCGSHSGVDVDKFKETGLTPVSVPQVRAPLVAECLSNIACRVVSRQDLGDHSVFFGEAVGCWVAERKGRGLLVINEWTGFELLHEGGRFRLGVVAE